jgi:hypothetical protein
MIKPVRTRSQVVWVTSLSALMLAGCLAASAGIQAWFALYPPAIELDINVCVSVGNGRITTAVSPLALQPSPSANCLPMPWLPMLEPPTARFDFPP